MDQRGSIPRTRAAIRAFLLPVAAGAAALLASFPASAAPASLVGSWSVQVTTYNCSTGAQNPAFTSLLSFSDGGTEAETTSNPMLALGQRSPAFGDWVDLGGGRYKMTTEALILFATQGGGQAPPIPQGTQVINQKIRLQGNQHFRSVATIQFFDQTGALALSGCATATGTRL